MYKWSLNGLGQPINESDLIFVHLYEGFKLREEEESKKGRENS
jgi:hypothetical protein